MSRKRPEQNVPNKTADKTNQNERETVRQNIQNRVVGQEETGEVQNSQVSGGDQEELGKKQQGSQASEGGLKKTGEVQKNSQVSEGGEDNIGKGQKAATGMLFGPTSLVASKQIEKCVNERVVKEVALTVGEIDMKDDEQALKVPYMKRKIQNNSERSQAKKGISRTTRAVMVAEQKDTV